MNSVAQLTDLLLIYTVTYGSPLIFILLLIGAAGVPMPCTFLVLAAGAFVHQGLLDIYTAIGVALVGSVLGDSLSYWMGRLSQRFVVQRFGESDIWQKAQLNFNLRGGIAIYLTRWLFTLFALPTNLVAGSAGYTYARFLVFDIAGEITWLLLFGGLGYSFSSSLEEIDQLISNVGGGLLGVILFTIGLVIIRHKKRQSQQLE